MGLITIIKLLHYPLVILNSALPWMNRESKFPKELNNLECREPNPGQLDEKPKHYLYAMD